MASIWSEGEAGWVLLQPHGFPDEATLHDLIARAPQVLPLSGSPKLVVLGREVPLGTGYADIVAVETGGRPVVIEVKLAKNPESRRAVIAQVLAYASNLYRSSIEALDAALKPALAKAGYGSIAEAVEAGDQDGSVDWLAFSKSLSASLESGDIRLVLVLDSAPSELIGVVGYLGAVAPNLTLDLVTIAAFQVDQRAVIVPQRIEPARVEPPATSVPKPITAGATTTYSSGSVEFEAGIDVSAAEHRGELRRLLTWAQSLEAAGLAHLRTGRGANRWTLVPILVGKESGLVTIWNDHGPAVSPWKTAFVKWAPAALAAIEAHDPPIQVGQGNSLKNVSDEVLALFREAYEEGANTRDG